jgi:hypothetical protein
MMVLAGLCGISAIAAFVLAFVPTRDINAS